MLNLNIVVNLISLFINKNNELIELKNIEVESLITSGFNDKDRYSKVLITLNNENKFSYIIIKGIQDNNLLIEIN